jgi:hypothetical protein
VSRITWPWIDDTRDDDRFRNSCDGNAKPTGPAHCGGPHRRKAEGDRGSRWLCLETKEETQSSSSRPHPALPRWSTGFCTTAVVSTGAEADKPPGQARWRISNQNPCNLRCAARFVINGQCRSSRGNRIRRPTNCLSGVWSGESSSKAVSATMTR